MSEILNVIKEVEVPDYIIEQLAFCDATITCPPSSCKGCMFGEDNNETFKEWLKRGGYDGR